MEDVKPEHLKLGEDSKQDEADSKDADKDEE